MLPADVILQALLQVSSDPDWSSLMASSQSSRAQTKRAVAQDQLQPLLDQLQACRALNSAKLSLIRNYYTTLLVSLPKTQSCNMYKVCRTVSCVLFVMLDRPSAKPRCRSATGRGRYATFLPLFTYFYLPAFSICFLLLQPAAVSHDRVNSARMTAAA